MYNVVSLVSIGSAGIKLMHGKVYSLKLRVYLPRKFSKMRRIYLCRVFLRMLSTTGKGIFMTFITGSCSKTCRLVPFLIEIWKNNGLST
jgi:hypothetical protein